MATKSSGKFSYKSARIKVDGEILKYKPNPLHKPHGRVGCFILSQRLDEKFNQFEIKIIDTGTLGCISVGLAPYNYPLDAQPGWRIGSVGFHADDGKLFENSQQEGHRRTVGRQFGHPCKAGDKMGCGIRKLSGLPGVQSDILFGGPQCKLEVFFTVNDIEIGSTTMVVPDNADGLHPVVGMHSPGECVQLTIIPGIFNPSDAAMDDFMVVDDTEEDWAKVYDVKVNGQVIEYIGKGINIHDVGLAQGKYPLSTRCHYFELEIIEPGQHCYIAIGLVHKNYPLHRHPGWNFGSIAYHADDGKIFLGKGQGIPFGPRCSRGDVMGCGIQFPVDYVTPSPTSDDDENDNENDTDQNFVDDLGANDDFGVIPFLDDFVNDVSGSDEELYDSGDDDDFLWPQPPLPVPAWIPKIGDGDFMPMDLPLLAEPARDALFNRFAFNHRRGDRLLRDRHAPPVPGVYDLKEKNLMVKVFFTRNGYMIGHKEVMMPKDGFFPAVGMLSPREKVKVDLRPLSG